MSLFFKSGGLALSLGVSWRDPVLDVGTVSLPGSPSSGDRYVLFAGHATHPNEIAEWDGSAWTYGVPAEGWVLYSDADDGLFVYDGSAWDYIGPSPDHNLLTGLQGGTSSEYYHLTAAEHTELAAIAALGTAGDKMLYTTAANTWAEADLTSAGRALLDDATAADQRTTLGLGTGDSPTWTGATLSDMTEGSVLFAGAGGLVSQDNTNLFWDDSTNTLTATSTSIGPSAFTFQPAADSTTAFQILDADGGTPVLNVDTTNERVGIGTDTPTAPFVIKAPTASPTDANVIEVYDLNNVLRMRLRDLGIPEWYINGGGGEVGSIRYSTPGNTPAVMIFGTNINQRATLKLKAAALILGASSSGSSPEHLIIIPGGNVGLNELTPETLLELTHAEPYITLHNETHEDTDGGGESRIIAKREDGSGTETECGQIEFSHDGPGADDQLGKIVYSVSTDSGLVEGARIDSNLDTTVVGNVKGKNRAKQYFYSGF